MNITIDGKTCECEKGEYILQIARRNGIEIPTLCHHDGFPGQGACRVCIVEVIERGRGKIVVSCIYPVEKECEVLTNSDKVKRQRGMILRLLQKRAPESEEIQALCEKYDAPPADRFITEEGGKCVMCGLCVKACAELGAGAISTVNRGVTKEIATPYHEPSSVCIGCGSCAYVCPTNAIDIKQTADERIIWGKTFKLVHCSRCGEVIGTEEEIAYAASRSGNDPDTLCDSCRKKQIAAGYGKVFGTI